MTGPAKRTKTRQGWETQLHNPTMRNDGALLSAVQHNTLASIVHFCVQSELVRQVHCIGGQRGGLHHSMECWVVLLSFLIIALFLSVSKVQPKLEMKFHSGTFPFLFSLGEGF